MRRFLQGAALMLLLSATTYAQDIEWSGKASASGNSNNEYKAALDIGSKAAKLSTATSFSLGTTESRNKIYRNDSNEPGNSGFRDTTATETNGRQVSFRISADWTPDDKNTFNAAYRHSWDRQDKDVDGSGCTFNLQKGSQLRRNYVTSIKEAKNSVHGLTLTYKRKVTDKNGFTGQLDIDRRNSADSSYYETERYLFQDKGGLESYNYLRHTQVKDNVFGKVSAGYDWGALAGVEGLKAGVRADYRFDRMQDTQKAELFDPEKGVWTNFQMFGTDYDILTETGTLRATSSYLSGHLDLSADVRFEMFHQNLGTTLGGLEMFYNDHRYNTVLCDIRAGYKFSEMNSVSLKYSRSINRPDYVKSSDSWTMNEDLTEVYCGNSELKPEYDDIVSLDFKVGAGRFRTDASGEWKRRRDYAEKRLDFKFESSDAISLYEWTNTFNEDSYKAKLSLGWEGKILKLSVSGYHIWKFITKKEGEDASRSTNYGFNADWSVSPGKGWKVNGAFIYTSPNRSAYSSIGEYVSASLRVGKVFLDKFEVFASGADLFDYPIRKRSWESSAEGYETAKNRKETVTFYNRRTVTFGLIYKF